MPVSQIRHSNTADCDGTQVNQATSVKYKYAPISRIRPEVMRESPESAFALAQADFGGVPERPNGIALKAIAGEEPAAGSNPAPSA